MGAYYFDCKIDGGFEKLHSSYNPENDCPICRIAELEQELQALREAGKEVVERMRGSGGLNPDAAEALLKLAALLEEE